MVFFANSATAIMVTLGNVIFQESLTAQLATRAPKVSSGAAIAAGGSAEAVRALARAAGVELEDLLLAYSVSVGRVFYLLVGLSLVMLASGYGIGWVDLRSGSAEGEGEKVQS